MNCVTIDSLLDDHKIDSLSAAEKAGFGLHLERCARCADAWLAHQILVAETPSGPRPGLLPAVLRTATLQRSPAQPSRASLWPWAAALAAGAVLAAITLLTLQTAREDGASPLAANHLTPGEQPGPFTAGVHYVALPADGAAAAASAPDVIEFFMYGCFPCYSFEPSVARWSQQLPSNVRFERVPALFNPLARLHAQAFYTAAALGKLDELHGMIFEQIHRNGNLLDSEAELAALFTRFGVDAATFSRTFRSPAVQLQLRRAEELNRAYRVSATPALVIHGSYLTTPALAGSPAALLAIADELLEERPSRCTARTGCDQSEPAKPIF